MSRPRRGPVLVMLLCGVLLVGGAVAVRLGAVEEPGPPAVEDPTSTTTSGADRPTPATGRPSPPDAGVDDTAPLADRAPEDFSRDGLVLENVRIDGGITLSGSNQTLRNARIEGGVLVLGDDVTIEDSSVGALAVSGASGFVARRLEVFGLSGSDGIHITSDRGRVTDLLIEDSWIHSPQLTPESHYDGIQVRGVDGLTVRGSHIDLGAYQPQYTSAVFLEDANGGNTRVLLENNWINGGGYAIHLTGEEIIVRDNVFGPDWEFGLRYPDGSDVTLSGNTDAEGAAADL